VLRTGRILTLHPWEGRAGALRCTYSGFKDIAISGALGCTYEMRGKMTILKAKPDAISDSDHTLNRVFPVTAKLTKEERGRVTEFARSQGLARGEWIRDVILREMRKGSASDPSLAEILGVRLLLVNVLRPLAAGQRLAPEAFDKLLDEISDAKHQLARKLATSAGRK
jgi:hypothetical protein